MEMKDPITKIKKPHWVMRFFILYFIFLVFYIAWLYFVMDVRITKKVDVQLDYGQYLVDTQDKMIERTLEFAGLAEDTNRVYTDEEKERITNELLKQNKLLKELQKNPPNESNEDYVQIYNDILKIFSFYIQGETMQANYIYGYKDHYLADEKFADDTVRQETYTMGLALCNMMGNMMLNNYTYINNVRNTQYESKYTIIPVDDLESYLKSTDEEREEILNSSTLEEVEDYIHGKTTISSGN